MRAKLVGFLMACGLLAASAAPAFACMYNNASTDSQTSQQTAEAQTNQSGGAD